MSAAGKSAGKGAGKAASLSRSRARLAAVQALYQMDLAETDLGAVLEEFSANPLVDDAEGDGLGKPDVEHMTRVLKGVVARQREIDPLIDNQLATGWRLVRIDSIVRAILRAAAFELMELADVPARVVISEYVEVAHAFFEGDESKVVNGVLDQLARKLREGELPTRG
jgi:N utilization substance protein B